MLQELLVELLKRAHVEQSVALAATQDGMQLLAYPLDQGMLIGIGLEGERTHGFDGAGLLRTRASDMARFASWLPAQLKDGAWYVVKRLPGFDPYAPALDESDLEAALELIS